MGYICKKADCTQLILSLILTLGTRIQSKEELQMHTVMESCVFKSVMSFVVGGALGGKFIFTFIIFSIFFKKFQIFHIYFSGFIGLFSSSIAPQHTTHQMSTRETLRDMRTTISGSAKNFAVIGLM